MRTAFEILVGNILREGRSLERSSSAPHDDNVTVIMGTVTGLNWLEVVSSGTFVNMTIS
jgi:hypothetical protein